jgi:hypothetical protein
MRGAIPPLPQYAFTAWCSVKAQGQLYLYLLQYKLDVFRVACIPGGWTQSEARPTPARVWTAAFQTTVTCLHWQAEASSHINICTCTTPNTWEPGIFNMNTFHFYVTARFTILELITVKVKLSLCFNWAPRHEGVLGEWRYSSTHSLTSALDGGEWSASRTGRFTPRERAPGTHWIGGWVSPRAVLDAVVKRKIPSPAGSRILEPR